MATRTVSKLVGVCLITTLMATGAALADVVPGADWTPEERHMVDGLRDFYRNQNMDLSQDQADAAVRSRRENAPVAAAKGIPPSEWTPKETQMIAQYRAAYQKQGMPFTDEQASLTVQSMRETIARLTGNMAVAQALASRSLPNMPAVDPRLFTAPQAMAQASTAASPSSLTEQQLAAEIAALPAKSGNLVVKQRREGFTINGQPVVDAEGRITLYAFDVVTGDVTFAVQTPNKLEIKYLRAGASATPITLAFAARTADGWSVQTVTGLNLSGNSISVIPCGLLVSRPGAAFRYDPGQGVKNIPVPEGYVLASIQRGNIGGTGFVLLERDIPPNDPQAGLLGTMRSMAGSVKALGANLGLNAKPDYALYNGDTNSMISLNIDMDGKDVTAMSGCHRQNLAINRCDSAQTFESLYEQSGGRNIHHYYWRAQWLNTPTGPIAVTLEAGNRDVFITDLASGKKVLAFHRALGIADMEVTQNPDGTVAIEAQLAFQHQSIPDAAAFLAQQSPVSPTVAANTAP